MTVEINQKKLYCYNYYTSGKFLTLNFKFQVKSSNTPPPSPSPNFRCFATTLHAKHATIGLVAGMMKLFCCSRSS
jgi:hypothetical protein